MNEDERIPATASRLAVVAVDDCMSSAVVGVVEACAIASAQAPAGRSIRTFVVSPKGGEVMGAADMPIPSTSRFDEFDRLDAIVLPPVFGSPNALLDDCPDLVEWTREANHGGTTVGAACTGTFLLAQTGALDGRRATTTPAFSSLFRARFPKVQLMPALRLVDEGTLITAGATTSYLDLALYLVARFLGPRVALGTARVLVTDANPRSQEPFLLPRPPRVHPDEAIRSVEDWIAKNLSAAFGPEELASVAALSRRSLTRRFRNATGESLTAYIQRSRVEAAMQALEGSQLSFEEITVRCGYDDVRSFRRLFRRHAGLSPREYRQRFGYVGRQP